MSESDLQRLLFFVTAISVGALWALESRFPFFKNRKARLKHARVNVLVGIFNTAFSSLTTIGLLLVLAEIRPYWQGLKGAIENPILASAVLVICLDLWAYFWHRLNHHVPFLWRFHRFHHHDSEMDVTTGFRFHPIEILLSELFRLPIFALLGIGAVEILLYNLISFPVILLHHSNVALPKGLDSTLAYLIPSPNFHRLHHSALQSEMNSNYGSLFSVWDRLFRSLVWREVTKELRLGVEEP
jgi:sterol desaturase/sphingolipid hydroxylase (fatty acid hydroxylase superfamily)